jgi:hypothetical protein
MRLQMLVPDSEDAAIKRLDHDTKQHFTAKAEKFKKESEAKLMLATMKNDQATIAKYNKQAEEFYQARMFLTQNNLVRAALAVGLKEMEKMSSDKVIELARKHGVSRGRPNGS